MAAHRYTCAALGVPARLLRVPPSTTPHLRTSRRRPGVAAVPGDTGTAGMQAGLCQVRAHGWVLAIPPAHRRSSLLGAHDAWPFSLALAEPGWLKGKEVSCSLQRGRWGEERQKACPGAQPPRCELSTQPASRESLAHCPTPTPTPHSSDQLYPVRQTQLPSPSTCFSDKIRLF